MTWPWKNEIPDLPLNRGLAMGRLKSTVAKLQSKPEFLLKYDRVIQEQIDKGVIEPVDRTSAKAVVCYLPHHTVINPQKRQQN